MAPPSDASSPKVVPILMPEAGNTMEEGTILTWHLGEGDRVSLGDILCEIETDKATIEYESPFAGRLAKIVAVEGDTIEVKQPIAYFAESNSDLETYLAASDATSPEPPVNVAPPRSSGQPTVESSGHQADSPTATGPSYPASPAVRRLARQMEIDLKSIGKGSGPGGRILSTDLECRNAAPPTETTSTTVSGESADAIRRPISKMRRRIGERLVVSKQSIPHFYVRTTVLADELYRVFRDTQHEGCSINDLVVLACGRILTQFPAFRSRIDGDEMIEEPGAHIGIAVGLDDGLVVPVIRHVQNLSLKQLSQESKRIIGEARRGIVANAGNGVFTISNLGMFGVEEFSAIINPPESGILAVGAVREQVIVENGTMRPGRVMTLTMSADHRLVDGVMAAKFLAQLKSLLENAGPSLAGE